MNLNDLPKMADSEPGIGKKILSLFIKEEDAPRTPVPQAPPATSPEPDRTIQTVQNAAGTMQIDRKFVEHFAALLEKANLPGPDYFEYKQVLQNMAGLGLTEEKQYQAAWASFKAMGGVNDPQILGTSAGQYLGVLEKDRTLFLQDVEKTLKSRVGSLQDEQKRLEESNAAIKEQIVALQKKMDENSARLGQISGEISDQSARINTNKEGFEVAYLSFVEQIKLDLTKVNLYIK